MTTTTNTYHDIKSTLAFPPPTLLFGWAPPAPKSILLIPSISIILYVYLAFSQFQWLVVIRSVHNNDWMCVRWCRHLLESVSAPGTSRNKFNSNSVWTNNQKVMYWDALTIQRMIDFYFAICAFWSLSAISSSRQTETREHRQNSFPLVAVIGTMTETVQFGSQKQKLPRGSIRIQKPVRHKIWVVRSLHHCHASVDRIDAITYY